MAKAHKNLLPLLIKVLKNKGLKVTEKRQMLLEVFLKSPHKHFDIDSLYRHVREMWPHYGIATLYRNLKILIENDIISENLIGNKKYYELKIFSKKGIHAHLVCKYCGSIDEYYSPEIIKIVKEIEKKYDFDVYYGELNFHGICSSCKFKLLKSSLKSLKD